MLNSGFQKLLTVAMFEALYFFIYLKSKYTHVNSSFDIDYRYLKMDLNFMPQDGGDIDMNFMPQEGGAIDLNFMPRDGQGQQDDAMDLNFMPQSC